MTKPRRFGDWVEAGRYWVNTKTGRLLPIIQGGALPATDVFTAADGTALTTYSANWTLNNGNFAIYSNSVGANLNNAFPLAHWNADVFANNQYSKGTRTKNPYSTYQSCGVSVRCAATGNTGYGFNGYDTSSELYKVVSGTRTQLGSNGSAGAEIGDEIYIEANGTSITPKLNGSTTGTPGTQTDSAIASGYAGLAGYGNHPDYGWLDTWEGGNLGAGGPQTITTSGIASGEAFGTLRNDFGLIGQGIATGEAFGSPQANLGLSAQGVASLEAFGTAIIQPGPVTVSPGGIASGEAFGAAQLNQDIAASGIGSDETFGAGQINLQLEPSGISSGENFGSPQLDYILTISGIASAETFGAHTITLLSGPQTIDPAGIASLESFGVLLIGLDISPSGIASVEIFGGAQLVYVISASGIVSLEAFGIAEIQPGPVFISPSGIASAEAFGTVILVVAGTGMRIVLIAFSLKQRAIDFDLKGRYAEFDMKNRDVDIHLD